MNEFRKVASALSRRTKDTSKDKTTDLDIAQSSHALKQLRELAAQNPELVLKALKIELPISTSFEPSQSVSNVPRYKRRKKRKIATRIPLLNFSTRFSRYGFWPYSPY